MRDGSGQRTTSHGSTSHGSSHGSSRGSSRGGGGSGGSGGAGRQSPISPMASVAFITLAALFGVGVLAIQANGSAPKVSNNSQSQPGTSLSPSGTAQVPVKVDLNALPADSGSGPRIVYSLAAKKIWLVDGTAVQRTAAVVPGTVAPTVGTHKVTSRTNSAQGSDGTSVQYVVVFDHASDKTSIGFDTVYGATGMPAAPTGKTGGIRMAQPDALAVWTFTNTASTVVVVP